MPMRHPVRPFHLNTQSWNHRSLALAHHRGGNLEMACDWFNRAVQHNYLPGWTVLASMSSDAEAKAAVEAMLKLDPHFSISRLVRRDPVSVRDRFETYYEGLRRAGVPD
jgi:hypothetical protein